MPALQLDAYRDVIALDRPFTPVPPARLEDRAVLLSQLVAQLLAEKLAVGVRFEPLLRKQSRKLRPRASVHFLTVRRPLSLSDAFHAAMDTACSRRNSLRQLQVEASSLAYD